MIRILIADDQDIVREGIKALLKGEENFVFEAEASSGDQVLEILHQNPVDIVLMDINMPGMDGISCAKLIRKFYPKVRVLMISVLSTEKYAIEVLSTGAAGFITKNSSKSEIKNAILTIAEGNSYFSKDVSEKISAHLRSEAKGIRKKTEGEEPNLTARESEVLKLIAQEFTNREIADKLFISHHTVVTHRRNLLQKLNAKNTAGLLSHAARHGLLTLSDF